MSDDDFAGPRTYRSGRRREQAEQTRARVLRAARELFARDGYIASIGVIAELADVAPQTVYAIYGNKGGLVRALLEELDAQAGLPELIQELRTSAGDPARQIQLVVDFDLALYQRAADVIGVAHAARGSQPEVAAVVDAGRERGRRGRRPLVERWDSAGLLQPGMTVDEAVEAFLALCSYDLYRLFVIEADWPTQRYRDWLCTAVRRSILVA